MRIYDIIKRKRDGFRLSNEEIAFFVKGVTETSVSDEQLGAFLMAVFLNGMDEAETFALTSEMTESGDTLSLPRFGNLSCDKHSSGGVGDKTTLVVAPAAAACGVRVAKMSGRGLGFTGGTIDKLESIPGFRTELSESEFLSIVDKTGMAVVSQTKNLAPCDKRMYAARDLTATVDSIPLIVSSIMSKKLAAGAHNIVLDVKCGKGAFAKSLDFAEILAGQMVNLAKMSGRNASALITDMNEPLGYAIGNALEVKEAVETLAGKGEKRFAELCTELAAEMVGISLGISGSDARNRVIKVMENGRALAKFEEFIVAQGAQEGITKNPDKLCKAKYQLSVLAASDGYVVEEDAEKLGTAALLLGAGRNKKGEKIDLNAGVILRKKTGDYVNKGEALATLFFDDENRSGAASEIALSAFSISGNKPVSRPIVIKKIN